MLSLKANTTPLIVYYVFSALMLCCGFVSIYTETYYLLLIPPAILFMFLSVIDMRFIYFLLLVMLPLSTEVALPNGFATDFPTEMLIGGLMILFIPYVLSKNNEFDIRFLKNPIIFFLVLHLAWVYFDIIFSSNLFVSLKYSLAKTWYIVTFVLVTSVVIRRSEDFRKAYWCILLPLVFVIFYTLNRHSHSGFSFETVNTMMLPFFRNHVSYACTIAQVIPFTFLAITWYKRGSKKRNLLIFFLLLLLAAVFLAYTRSAWLALITALIAIPIIRMRLLKWSTIAGFAAAIIFFVYMGYHNQYLNYAPEFDKTIYHPELGDHLASTFEGHDISSEERVYRWVAAVRMWMYKPITGYGPGNFYNFYRGYTVNSFQTYVSENLERSSVHNYFLLVLTEQGIIGLIIFILFTLAIIINGERIYHQTIDKGERKYILAILLCIIIIYVNTFLSDLLETDKIGSFFFICIALLVNQDLKNKQLKAKELSA